MKKITILFVAALVPLALVAKDTPMVSLHKFIANMALPSYQFKKESINDYISPDTLFDWMIDKEVEEWLQTYEGNAAGMQNAFAKAYKETPELFSTLFMDLLEKKKSPDAALKFLWLMAQVDDVQISTLLDWQTLSAKDQTWPMWEYEFEKIPGLKAIPFREWVESVKTKTPKGKEPSLHIKELEVGGQKFMGDDFTSDLLKNKNILEMYHKKADERNKKALNDLAASLKAIG